MTHAALLITTYTNEHICTDEVSKFWFSTLVIDSCVLYELEPMRIFYLHPMPWTLAVLIFRRVSTFNLKKEKLESQTPASNQNLVCPFVLW